MRYGTAGGRAQSAELLALGVRRYGLIKLDLQEADLDTADRYGASVAIGEQVP